METICHSIPGAAPRQAQHKSEDQAMTRLDDAPAIHQAPDWARMSSLSKALLGISASLVLDTILREVVGGARALTVARYGCIA